MTGVKNSQLVVVLGMHRSGTSAITRGLRVMGVSLGDRMMSAVAGDNPKGYWEDIDLNALNIEMLHAIDSDWFHVTAIDSSDVEFLHRRGYFLRAVELLRQKVGGAPVFGYKDPRVAKLLPFWKGVFSHCQFEVSYVVAVRHPLSVGKSLAKRDGIALEQGYLLWLCHVVTGLLGSSDDKRVLVDYDRLIQAPDRELIRISQYLGLEIDQNELESYKVEFLDQGLRHTLYEMNDLLSDGACPPIVREVYAALLDVAADKTKLDDPELRSKVARWSDEFERLKSPLVLVDKLLRQKVAAAQAVAERDGLVADLTQRNLEVQEKDSQLHQRNLEVQEKDSQLHQKNLEVREKDSLLHQRNLEVQEKDSLLHQRNLEVQEKDSFLHQRNLEVEENNVRLAAYKDMVQRKDDELKYCEEQIRTREETLAQIYKSLWWRMSVPFRKLAVCIGKTDK